MQGQLNSNELCTDHRIMRIIKVSMLNSRGHIPKLSLKLLDSPRWAEILESSTNLEKEAAVLRCTVVKRAAMPACLYADAQIVRNHPL